LAMNVGVLMRMRFERVMFDPRLNMLRNECKVDAVCKNEVNAIVLECCNDDQWCLDTKDAVCSRCQVKRAVVEQEKRSRESRAVEKECGE